MKKIVSIILAALMLLTIAAFAECDSSMDIAIAAFMAGDSPADIANDADIGTSLTPPWYIYQKQVKALFEHDSQIIVGEVYQQENGKDYAFDIEVRNHEKYMALDRVLSRFKLFGNVALTINLFDEENSIEENAIDICRVIFDGNPIVESIEDIVDPAGVHHGFVVFCPKIIQYYADDMRDINGNVTTLAQNIAREVFNDAADGVNFCTGKVAVG